MSGGWGTGWGGAHWADGGGGVPSGVLANLSYEIPDLAGDAAFWSQLSVSTFGEWASYLEGAQLRAVETFEGSWSSNDLYLFAFVAADLEAAHYTALLFNPPLTAESFEAGWSHNEHFYTTTADFEAAIFLSGDAFDGFESGWDNDTWGAFTLSAATYSSTKPAEDFEDGWRSNQASVYDWTGVSSAAAVYAGVRAIGREDFEHVKPDAPFTIGGIGDLVQTGHGLALDYRVQVFADVGSTLPSGLDAAATYWIVSVLDADHVLISLSHGGAPLAPIAGIGVSYLHAPFEFWTALTTTI